MNTEWTRDCHWKNGRQAKHPTEEHHMLHHRRQQLSFISSNWWVVQTIDRSLIRWSGVLSSTSSSDKPLKHKNDLVCGTYHGDIIRCHCTTRQALYNPQAKNKQLLLETENQRTAKQNKKLITYITIDFDFGSGATLVSYSKHIFSLQNHEIIH